MCCNGTVFRNVFFLLQNSLQYYGQAHQVTIIKYLVVDADFRVFLSRIIESDSPPNALPASLLLSHIFYGRSSTIRERPEGFTPVATSKA